MKRINGTVTTIPQRINGQIKPTVANLANEYKRGYDVGCKAGYEAGVNDFGLKGKGQGELVTLNNVHPIEHKVGVKLGSKNLFDISKIESTAVITNNNDGTLTISGTYSARTGKTLGEICPTLKGGDTVVFQVETTGNPLIYLSGSNYTWNTGGSKTITEADLNSIVVLYGKSDSGTYTISNIQIETGTTATVYAPYIADLNGAKVKACGKNLFNEDKANITKTEDYFKSNVSYWQRPCFTLKVESGATYTCSCEYYTPNTTTFNAMLAYSISKEKTYTSAGKALAMRLKTQSSTEGYSKVKDTFTVPDGIEEVYFLTDNEGVGTYFKKFQIEKGTTATEYEPYIGAEYTAAADGTVEGVKSISPTMNLRADKAGAVIDAECFLDPAKIITSIVTLGGEL